MISLLCLLAWRYDQHSIARTTPFHGSKGDRAIEVLRFLFSFYKSFIFARYRLKYCLKGPLSPKQPTNPSCIEFNSHCLAPVRKSTRHQIMDYSFARNTDIFNRPSEPATFVQRLRNVFQTPRTFGTCWVVVVQMSLVHWRKTVQVQC